MKLKDLIRAGVGDARRAGAWGGLLPAAEASLTPLLEVEMPAGSRVDIAEPGDERDPVASELISIYVPLAVDEECKYAGGRCFNNPEMKIYLEYFWAGYAEHEIGIFNHCERFVENVKDRAQFKCDNAVSVGGCALLILKGILTVVVPSGSAGCATLGLNYSGRVAVWTGRSRWDYWMDAKWRKLVQKALRHDLECFGVKRLDEGHVQASYSRVPAKRVWMVGRNEWIRLLRNS